jgi:hypothetical protein
MTGNTTVANRATNGGGAYLTGATGVVRDNTITGNNAMESNSGGASGTGGGLYSYDCSLTISYNPFQTMLRLNTVEGFCAMVVSV